MLTIAAYVGAALAEIAGCFAFWVWLRLGKSSWWIAPGIASLALFAWLLTLVDSKAAGRAYAAYGGVYVCAALLWLWTTEGVRPDRWDIVGGLVCVAGTAIILLGHRTAWQIGSTDKSAPQLSPFARDGEYPKSGRSFGLG